MDNIQAVQNEPVSNVTKKSGRRRIAKLSATALAAFPGAALPQAKKVAPDFAYYLAFLFPVTGRVGTPVEATQVHDFASQLNTHAKAKGVGEVSSVAVAEGQCEVVLTLGVTGEQADQSAPAASAFANLKDFLAGAALLKQGSEGKPATYKIKVNGTTTGVGSF